MKNSSYTGIEKDGQIWFVLFYVLILQRFNTLPSFPLPFLIFID